jgi:DNA-binding transcriptional LysR family regulator
MEFDTTRLRSFLHVAELGTVAAAAESLGFTAPAVSQHITKLEAQLDVPLFERANGRLSLSAHGEQLVPIATSIVDLADSAAARIAAPKSNRRVAIAGFASAIRTIVLPAMQEFPNVMWDVRDAEDDDALQSLRLGSVDVAIVQEYNNLPHARDDRLHYMELTRDRLRLVVPASLSRTATLNELASTGWLANGTGTRCEAATNQILNSAAILPRVVGRISDGATLFALVAAGLGATIAPERMLVDAIPGVVVSSASLGVTRQILAVRRASTHAINADIVKVFRQVAKRPRTTADQLAGSMR